jgi:cytochrome c biogenesis protein CcdA
MIILFVAIGLGFFLGLISQYIFGWIPVITLAKIPLLNKMYASWILSGIIGSSLTLIFTGVFAYLTERTEAQNVVLNQSDSKSDTQPKEIETPKHPQETAIILKR